MELKQNLAVLRDDLATHRDKFEECKQKLSNEIITTDLQKEVHLKFSKTLQKSLLRKSTSFKMNYVTSESQKTMKSPHFLQILRSSKYQLRHLNTIPTLLFIR